MTSYVNEKSYEKRSSITKKKHPNPCPVAFSLSFASEFYKPTRSQSANRMLNNRTIFEDLGPSYSPPLLFPLELYAFCCGDLLLANGCRKLIDFFEIRTPFLLVLWKVQNITFLYLQNSTRVAATPGGPLQHPSTLDETDNRHLLD